MIATEKLPSSTTGISNLKVSIMGYLFTFGCYSHSDDGNLKKYNAYIYSMKLFAMCCFLLTFGFVFKGCTPSEPPSVKFLGQFSIGSEAESYIKFNPGSYWVYENSETGILDTVFMNSYVSEDIDFLGERNSFIREDVQFSWRNGTTIVEYKLQHPWVDITPEPVLDSFVFYTFKPVEVPILNFFYPFVVGSKRYYGGQETTINAIHETYLLNGKEYKNVVEFELDVNFQANDYRTFSFWAQDVGLIQQDFYISLSMEFVESNKLISHQIVP